MNSVNIAAAGIQSAIARFDESARRTAQAPLDNLAEEHVERLVAQREVEANITVVKAADAMMGTLLDTRA